MKEYFFKNFFIFLSYKYNIRMSLTRTKFVDKIWELVELQSIFKKYKIALIDKVDKKYKVTLDSGFDQSKLTEEDKKIIKEAAVKYIKIKDWHNVLEQLTKIKFPKEEMISFSHMVQLARDIHKFNISKKTIYDATKTLLN